MCSVFALCGPNMNLRAHDGAAVGVEHLAGHVAGVVRGQEHIAGGNLAGLARPKHGHLGGAGAEGAHLLRREGRWDQRRPDGAGGHGVHPDALLRQGKGQGTGEGHDGPFCGAVVDEVLVPLVSGDGGGVDDGAALAQMGQGRLDQVEIGVHIVLEHQRQLFPGYVQNAAPDELDGVVVYEDIQRSEALRRPLHAGFCEGRIFQISPQKQALAAQLTDAFGGLLCVPIFIVVGDGYFCPFFDKSVGHRPPDPTVPAGDEGYTARQPWAGWAALRDGARGHLIFQAGLLVLVLGRKGAGRGLADGTVLTFHKSSSFRPFYGG